MDQAGQGRHPSTCLRFRVLTSFFVSTVSIVTGIRRVGVIILITVIVIGFSLSHLVCMSNMSTVTGIRRVGGAILVIVVVFELSHDRCMAKVPTVTRISVPFPPKKWMSHSYEKKRAEPHL